MDRLTREQIELGSQALSEALSNLAVAQQRFALATAPLKGSHEGEMLRCSADAVGHMIRFGESASANARRALERDMPGHGALAG